MAVTGLSGIQRPQVLAEIERLVSSQILHGSESLCRLLQYLAAQSLNHAGEQVKEHQIAMDVFGRPESFDPRLDAIVRVQTSRLRAKLTEYYASVGMQDSIIVELPKGSYALTYHPAVLPETVPAANPITPLPLPSTGVRAARDWRLSVIGGLSITTLLLTGALLFLHYRERTPVRNQAPPPSPSLSRFWAGYLDRSDIPLLVYSNAEFVGRPETGMRYFDPARDRREDILDHYTGVGEVIAVQELSRLFQSFGHSVRVKRGRLLSLDDAKTHDLIFIGSPSENLSLRELPNTQEFGFRLIETGGRTGDLAIVNMSPRPGEPAQFLASENRPLKEDYALIALLPGLTPTHHVMVLAGTTTLGTQAAVEYVCHADHVGELLKRTGRAEAAPFEAVLRVKVSGGVPVQSQVVALHSRP